MIKRLETIQKYDNIQKKNSLHFHSQKKYWVSVVNLNSKSNRIHRRKSAFVISSCSSKDKSTGISFLTCFIDKEIGER
jgi:hypothetical protein